jgi:hypothetical protein
MDRQRIASLVPMAHVADIAASREFYARLGFEEQGSFTPDGAAGPSWVSLISGRAELMLSLAGEPVVPSQQAVLFYLYCEDVTAMHAQVTEEELNPGPMKTPFYNPRGEFRLVDPDGYVVMVTHL